MKTEIKINKRFKPWATYPSGSAIDRTINGIRVSFQWASRDDGPALAERNNSWFFWGVTIRTPE